MKQSFEIKVFDDLSMQRTIRGFARIGSDEEMIESVRRLAEWPKDVAIEMHMFSVEKSTYEVCAPSMKQTALVRPT